MVELRELSNIKKYLQLLKMNEQQRIKAVMIVVFVILAVLINKVSPLNCNESQTRLQYTFYLIKSFRRSLMDKLHVDNVDTLESCMQMASMHKGLAFNYSPTKDRFSQKGTTLSKINRDHYWQQPQLYFNCHILQCPENHASKSLINDSSFDYYSLYDTPIEITNYFCVPQVGLFSFHATTETFLNASMICQHNSNDVHHSQCGALAHVASGKRTSALAQIMLELNQNQIQLKLKPRINLAYVGLYFNRTRGQRFQMFNMDGNSLDCFAYRAWEPGNPKMRSQFKNTSCVALTSRSTWLTVDCRRKLPYFCEILTKCENDN